MFWNDEIKLIKKLRALNTYIVLQLLYNICHQCYMYWFNNPSLGVTYTKIKVSTMHTARVCIFLKDYLKWFVELKHVALLTKRAVFVVLRVCSV
jgi:hypothetical protein